MDNCKEKIDLGHYWDLKGGGGGGWVFPPATMNVAPGYINRKKGKK